MSENLIKQTFCKNVDIKQIKGINFKCKEGGASFSVPFATQQLYSYTSLTAA